MIAEPITDTVGKPHAGTPLHAFVQVNTERCVGCQECIIRCPTGALTLDSEKWIAQANDQLCVGCRQCERVCPYSAIAVSGPLVVGPRQQPVPLSIESLEGDAREIRQGFSGWADALLECDRCLNCPDPTCMEGCPAHNDISGFIEAVRERNLPKAHSILRETTILPDICSRVCDQSVQCEGACSWSLAGGKPVAIGLLERFVTDHHPTPGVGRTSDRGLGLSVAVVGSGPAGCAAAWELLAAGARVTTIEKDSEAGGVLRWGIPAFTLPDRAGRRPILGLLAAGLDLKTDCALGRDTSLDALLKEHDAVILAHGASQPIVPPIVGRDLAGVEDAQDLLERGRRALREGEPLPDIGPGKHVLVVGGGNTAMDVARTVRRFGASVTAVEWMDERFARVRPDELEEGRSEGVDVRFTTTVERIEGKSDSVYAAWLRRTRQKRVNQRPSILSGPAERILVDRVVFALGYRVDSGLAAAVVTLPLPQVNQSGTIPDRRWIASGIQNRGRSEVGSQALDREVGLAVAGSPAQAGWWTKLWKRPERPASFFRTHWWGRIWKRQAATGLAAAGTPVGASAGGRVWVAGDALVGPSTVVGSMAHGREAARAVLRMQPRRPKEPAKLSREQVGTNKPSRGRDCPPSGA